MQNTNLNTAPYFDDFNRDKNFYKVLFRPGYPVQARELTTLQSILQNQIENFGKSIFKDGSMVIPGQIGYDLKYYSVKINPVFAGIPVESFRESLKGLTITGLTSGVTANIVDTLSSTDPENSSGYTTLFVKYITSNSSDNLKTTFDDNEELICSSDIVVGTTIISTSSSFASTISQNSTSIGSAAYINTGVYYIRGYFVDVPSQSVILDPFTNSPSYKVGLQITESIVTPEEDNSLYDNAIGTTNYTAPGANRFKISTELIKKDLDDNDTTNFIELLRIKNGLLQTFVTRSSYSELEKELAKRTFDTNGDYYVKPFDVYVRENLSNGINNGVYTPLQTTDSGNTPSSSSVSIQVSPGSAFVRGFQIETFGSKFIDVSKPRTTNRLENLIAPNILGNYVEVGAGTTDFVGMFNLTSGPSTVNLHNSYSSSVSSGSGTTIGYARVVDVQLGSSNISTNSNVYKIYLTDLEFFGGSGSTYKFSDVKSIISPGNAYANLREVLNEKIILSGNNTVPVISSGSTGILNGFISNYNKDLRIGDIITAGSGSSGALQRFRVESISSGSSALITNLSGISSVGGAYQFTINRPRLENGTDVDLLSELPKNEVKTLIPETIQVRQQKTGLAISGNTITVVCDTGFTFSNPVASDFVGSDSSNVPLTITNVSCNSPFTTAILTTSGNSGTARVSYSATKSSPVERIKTPRLMQVLDVVNTTGLSGNGLTNSSVSGTRIQDNIISLGIPDAFRLHAVYESSNDSSPVIPNFASSVTSFVVGEIISGSTTKSLARIVNANGSTVSFVYLSDSVFVNGEIVTGFVSGTVATVASLNNGSTNIKNNYVLDDGQRDQLYDFSRIVRNLTSPTPTRRLRVVFDYFDRTQGGDFFSVNSYSGISYEDIPEYRNKSLSDYIDYRYSVNKNITGSGTISSPHIVTSETLNFSSRSVAGISSFNILRSGATNTFDLEYYLGRIDKLFLSKEGEFKVIQGQPAEIPTEPSNLDDSMLIARIEYPAYLRKVNSALVTKYGNKRYTMKDIGDLENRIQNVEYYTQLNLLESDTERMTITDSNGLNRFKNGFLVDNFTNHSKGDVANQDYECSIDSQNGILRPSHYTTNVPLLLDESNSSNIQKTGSLITLPYESIVSISQPYASRVENVNPFNVFAWIGRIDLSPASDDWVDTRRLQDSVTNVEGDFANTARLMNADQNGFAPTEWNAWETTWTGTTVSTSGAFVAAGSGGRPWLVRDTFTTTTNQSRTGIRPRIVPRVDNINLGDRVLSRSFITHIRSRNISFTANRVKPKTRFYPFFDGNDVSAYVTPKLIEITMQSGSFQIGEVVVGRSSGCRLLVVAPNDGFTNNPYSTTSEILPSIYSATSTILNHNISILSEQISGNYFGRVVAGEILVGQTSGAVATSTSTPRLVSDQNGTVSGSLFIPDPSIDSNPRFFTGERIFRLSTNSNNSLVTGTVESSAEATYTASGTLQTVQANILSVRNSDVIRDTVTDTRTVVTTRQADRQVGWYDPLAESFLVTTKGGEYITGVDLFFQSKDDTNIPVSIQIRTMENGTPTKTILPFSDVTVQARDVNISTDSSVPTRFTFPSPVFIRENIEYALVVLSDSNKYGVWVSRMGENDVRTNSVISNQPYAGVLFKSQNASTWSPDQFEDLKFTIYRAKFTSSTGTASFKNSPLARGNGQILNLSNNALQMVGNGTSITVLHSNHSMHSTLDYVTISGAVSEISPTTLTVGIGASTITSISVGSTSGFHTIIGGTGVSSVNPGYLKIDNEIFSYSSIGNNTFNILARAQGGTVAASHSANASVECYNLNGVPLTQINTTHQIKNPTLDGYQINVTSQASTNLNAGGNSIFATQNVQYEALIPQIQNIVLPDTELFARYKGVSAKSIDGTETPYLFDSGFIPVELNITNYLSTPKLIASEINKTNNLNNQDSFKFELNFVNNGIDNLSPVVDLERASVIATTNRIRGNIQSQSLEPIGDLSKAIYVTKLVKLKNSASSLKVMLSAWRPTSAIIDVYYRVLPLNSQTNIDTISYTKFADISSSIPNPSDQEIYNDYEFNVDNLNFGAFSIKIVMRSTNQALVPQIRDLRIIALT